MSRSDGGVSPVMVAVLCAPLAGPALVNGGLFFTSGAARVNLFNLTFRKQIDEAMKNNTQY
jgi:hypothetical protein